MDILVELNDPKTGRKVYQYIDSEGKKGRTVRKKQDIVDLKEQGKLKKLNMDEINFSSKRKRSVSSDPDQLPLIEHSTTSSTKSKTPPGNLKSTEDNCGDQKGDAHHSAQASQEEALVFRGSLESQQEGGDSHGDASERVEYDDERVRDAHADLSSERVGDNESQESFQEGAASHGAVIESLDAGFSGECFDGSEVSVSMMDDQSEVLLLDDSFSEDINNVTVKVKNELLKKANAIESMKVSTRVPGLKEVCKSIDQFRAEESARSFDIDGELREKMINILTDEETKPNDLYGILSSSQSARDFFLNEIVQEAVSFGTQKTVLKVFPPDLKENICLCLVEEMEAFAPNLLSLLVKFCSKPNEPVTEKQVRKIIQLASQLTSSLNQKNSSLQKLVSLKLKLSSTTNAGIDFLHDLGVTQSSRSLQRDNDYLASISRDCIVEELKGKSFSFLVDNLDKVVNGTLVNFTSVILVVDRETGRELSTETENSGKNFFGANYLGLDENCKKKLMAAVTHILGHMLVKILPAFGWINTFLSTKFEHELSEIADKPTFWSYIGLLPLSEQKNSDMVEILDFLNEFTLEMLWKTAEDPESVKSWIDTIKNCESADEEVELAESKLMKLAQTKGLPSVIGDQLTYERAFIAKKLRSGSINKIESFDLLQFRLAMFHELMAKVRKDYSTFLPTLSNTLDKGTLAYFRARLSKHDITNDDGNFEKHLDFFSSISEESLKTALKEHFSQQEQVSQANQNLSTLQKLLVEFMDSNNIVLFWGSKSGKEPFDDLHSYHSRLVSSHLMNKIHKLFSKSGDGQGLRVVNRVATSYFLNAGGHRSKYAKYSYKDNVCHDSSSALQKQRNDLSTTVNAWGGGHSVDCDQFQEHRIKNIKGFLDNLHGNLDPTNVDKALKSADLELKISAEIERSMNISYKGPSTSRKFLTDEEVSKVGKIMNQIKPFSSEREPVMFVEPLKEKDNFSKLDAEPNVIVEFLDRNKGQYSTWGPFV